MPNMLQQVFNLVWVARSRISAFLRRTSLKHMLEIVPFCTSDGRAIYLLGLSFKSIEYLTAFPSSSTIILWRIIQACMILLRTFWFHDHAGWCTILKRA
uniref:Uncharacterized protein n=1 Tax=Arundo donax TaxID=35708 RepID=A0A0A9FEB5_ARUDO